MSAQPFHLPTCACGLRLYQSKHAALLAHRKAGFRVRVFECREGKGLHAANADQQPMRGSR